MSGFYVPGWVGWLIAHFWSVVAVIVTLGCWGIWLFVQWLRKP